ncbi:hypothetical protein [uncultured Corynebacterium sp.]|uniref:hypothetical protein n=1 Tax=uncultured Corynebacterium sp. TaxID=159447 RepID=UPI0025E0EB98|nr:hypothetical protein [uncultured Corynebacterium sp.]
MRDLNDLERWFSHPCMCTYAHHRDPEAFYVWNTQPTTTFLEDIVHVKVLLRNGVDTAVSPSVEDFKTEINEFYRLRNRCAHHEPLVEQDQEEESADLDRYEIVIKNVSNWVDPEVSQWIT